MPLKTIVDAVEGVADSISKVISNANRKAREERLRVQAELESHASEAGLEDTRWKSGRLYGRMFGVAVKWYETSHKPKNSSRQYWAHSESTFVPPLAAAFNVRTPGFMDHFSALFGGKAVKGKLMIRDNALTQFMMTDDIRAGLEALRNLGGIQIATGTLKVTKSGRMGRCGPFLANGVQVTELIVARWRERVAGIEALGFTPTDTAGVWEGHVDGVRIQVAETRRKKSLYTTIVRAKLIRPLPQDTLIVKLRKKKKKPKGAQPLGDMMLDRMLVAVSSDIGAVSARVNTDSARAPLLEIVHGHLHSKVTATHIELRQTGPIVGDSGVQLVAELHNALHF